MQKASVSLKTQPFNWLLKCAIAVSDGHSFTGVSIKTRPSVSHLMRRMMLFSNVTMWSCASRLRGGWKTVGIWQKWAAKVRCHSYTSILPAKMNLVQYLCHYPGDKCSFWDWKFSLSSSWWATQRRWKNKPHHRSLGCNYRLNFEKQVNAEFRQQRLQTSRVTRRRLGTDSPRILTAAGTQGSPFQI